MAREATETLLWFLGVVAVLGGFGTGIGEWFKNLNTFQTISFSL